jgi:hypothetical protein
MSRRSLLGWLVIGFAAGLVLAASISPRGWSAERVRREWRQAEQAVDAERLAALLPLYVAKWRDLPSELIDGARALNVAGPDLSARYATAVLREVGADSPAAASAYLWLGRAAAQAGDLDAAERWFAFVETRYWNYAQALSAGEERRRLVNRRLVLALDDLARTGDWAGVLAQTTEMNEAEWFSEDWDRAKMHRLEALLATGRVAEAADFVVRESESTRRTNLSAVISPAALARFAGAAPMLDQVVARLAADNPRRLEFITMRAAMARDFARMTELAPQINPWLLMHVVPDLFVEPPPREAAEAFLQAALSHPGLSPAQYAELNLQLARLRRDANDIGGARKAVAAGLAVGLDDAPSVELRILGATLTAADDWKGAVAQLEAIVRRTADREMLAFSALAEAQKILFAHQQRAAACELARKYQRYLYDPGHREVALHPCASP